MAIRINAAAFKGVPLTGFAGSNGPAPLRYFIRIPGVDINNIKLLGIAQYAKQSNTSDQSRYYVIRSFQIRFSYDSFLIESPTAIIPTDVIQFIPLYDFPSVIVNDIL